jgi:hypothetical protein
MSFEVKDTTDTDTEKSASYLNLHLEIDNGGRLKTKLYDKLTFPIVIFPFIVCVWSLHFTAHTLF